MNRGPVAAGILQASGDLIPFRRLVRLKRILRFGFHAEGHAEIADIADRIVFFGENLSQRLTRILVVVRDIVVEIGLDRLEHRSPVRPFRWAIVADDVGRFGGLPGRDQRQREQGKYKTDGLHGSLRFRAAIDDLITNRCASIGRV